MPRIRKDGLRFAAGRDGLLLRFLALGAELFDGIGQLLDLLFQLCIFLFEGIAFARLHHQAALAGAEAVVRLINPGPRLLRLTDSILHALLRLFEPSAEHPVLFAERGILLARPVKVGIERLD